VEGNVLRDSRLKECANQLHFLRLQPTCCVTKTAQADQMGQ